MSDRDKKERDTKAKSKRFFTFVPHSVDGINLRRKIGDPVWGLNLSGNDLCEYFTNNSFSALRPPLVCRLYPTTAPSRSDAKDVGKCCPFFPLSVPGGADPMELATEFCCPEK